MRHVRWILVLAVPMLSLVFGRAHAQTAPPPAKQGFQLALRTGLAVPFGNVTSTTAASDAFSLQVPLFVDIGGKPIPHLFIGAYLGAAVGGAAGQLQSTCQQLGVNCVGVGFRAGALIEYNARPGEAINPWFGYGFGYEIGNSNGSNDRSSITNSFRGFEYAHVLAGLDFRLQEYFGIGPFLDGAIGSYDDAESETNVGGLVTKQGGSVNDRAFHGWLIVGVRAVLLP